MYSKFYVFIFCIIAVVCNVIAIDSGVTESSLNIVGYSCITILVSYFVFDYKINNSYTYSSLFVLILFIFHFGQLVLFTCFAGIYNHVRFLLLLDINEALHGFRIMTISLSALCLGILWKSSSHKLIELKDYENNIDWIRFSKKIIYATFFVKLGLDISTLFISLTVSGIAARQFVNSFPNILLFYGKISLMGFALLLVSLKEQPEKQNKLFVFIVGYILLMMMSGIRSENVGYLAVYLFIYLQSKLNSLKIKQILLYVVLGFCGLTFIVAVGQFRNYSEKGVDSFFILMDELMTKHNVILNLFDTCGDTGYTAQVTINNYLPQYAPTYGDAYYKGISAVIPNLVPSIVDIGKITEDSSCPIRLQNMGVLNAGYLNIGGSFFAELYMNFGIVGGIIMCFIWGLFFGWVGKRASLAFSTNNLYQLMIVIPIMFASIYWVRSYFGGGIREVVWDILFGLFILKRTIHG